jgi:hypothetical protein
MCVAQVVEHLPSNHGAQSSDSSMAKTIKKVRNDLTHIRKNRQLNAESDPGF